MNVAIELQGERLAKDAAARARAFESLGQRQQVFALWQYFAWLVVGGAWGVFLSQSTSMGQGIVGGAAGAAFFLAAAAFRECLSLRRRLDASLVLVLAREAP